MRPMHALVGCVMLSLVVSAPAARVLPNPHLEELAVAGGASIVANRGMQRSPDSATLAGHAALPLTGTHYLYVEDGSCPVKVDVYKVTANGAALIQTYTAANACQYGAIGYGENEFAHATVGRSKCLVVTSTNQPPGPPGTPDRPGSVLSYQIDAGTGQIRRQVSKIMDPLRGGPYDVKLSANQRYAIVTTDDGYHYAVGAKNGVSSYALGAGCTLTLASTAAGPTSPHAGNFVSSAITSNGEVVTADPGTSSGEHKPGALDFFSFNPATGALAYQTAQWSQISQPYGIVADGALVFTGQWGFGNRVQAGTVASHGTIAFVAGSPAADPSHPSGSSTVAWYDETDRNFVVEEAATGGTLGFFHAAPFRFSQRVKLAAGPNGSTETFAQSGKALFVAEYGTQAIEACALTHIGSSGCVVIAHLPSYGGPQGLAVS